MCTCMLHTGVYTQLRIQTKSILYKQRLLNVKSSYKNLIAPGRPISQRPLLFALQG